MPPPLRIHGRFSAVTVASVTGNHSDVTPPRMLSEVLHSLLSALVSIVLCSPSAPSSKLKVTASKHPGALFGDILRVLLPVVIFASACTA